MNEGGTRKWEARERAAAGEQGQVRKGKEGKGRKGNDDRENGARGRKRKEGEAAVEKEAEGAQSEGREGGVELSKVSLTRLGHPEHPPARQPTRSVVIARRTTTLH